MSLSSIGAARTPRERRRRRFRARAAGLPMSVQNRPTAVFAHHELGGFAAPWPRDAR
jgi:hypothetical protein